MLLSSRESSLILNISWVEELPVPCDWCYITLLPLRVQVLLEPGLSALHLPALTRSLTTSRAATVKPGKLCAHLVLLLEAVTLGTFHLSDVLQQVGHSDGRVQLTRLIRQGLPLRLPLLVVGLDKATGFTGHSVTVIWGRMMRGEIQQENKKRKWGGGPQQTCSQ